MRSLKGYAQGVSRAVPARTRSSEGVRQKLRIPSEALIVAEMSFRKLDAPQLVEKVAQGTKYDNGEEVRDAA
jgi:hypothetical protein